MYPNLVRPELLYSNTVPTIDEFENTITLPSLVRTPSLITPKKISSSPSSFTKLFACACENKLNTVAIIILVIFIGSLLYRYCVHRKKKKSNH